MGVYDDVDIEIDCPTCGAKVDGFQTKDGPMCFKTLVVGIPFKWDIPYILKNLTLKAYSTCDKCRSWIEISIPLIPVNSEMVLMSHEGHVIKTPELYSEY